MIYRSREGRFKRDVTKLMFGVLPFLLITNNLHALQNLSYLDINYAFTVPSEFYNLGDLYVTGNGSISGTLLGGRSLHVGINSSQAIVPNNFTSNNTIAGISNIFVHDASSFTINHSVTGVTGSFVVENGARTTLNNTLVGAGGNLYNKGKVYFKTGSSIYMRSLINDGEVEINGATINYARFINNKLLTIQQQISGYGEILNTANGTLSFENSAENKCNIENQGNLFVNGTALNIAQITNYKRIEINASLQGDGKLNNKARAIINIKPNATLTNKITNEGILNVHNASINYINNKGCTNLHGQVYVNDNIDNTGIINLYASINMPGKILRNKGIINVYGQHNLTVENLNSSGATLNFSIYGADNNDRLDCSDTVDLTKGSVINVDTQFFGKVNSTYTWRILTAPNILVDDSTIVNTPPSLMNAWNINCGTDALEISNNIVSFASLAATPDHHAVACALDKLSHEDSSMEQAPLFMALAASPNQATFDNALQQLMPKQSNNLHSATLQKTTLNKVETRMSNLRGTVPYIPTGISSGDINADTALWTGAFGSLANQDPYSKSYGYYAKSLGGLMGIDRFTDADNIYGMALGVSNSNLYEDNQSSITRMLGYHLILYGSTDLATDSYFMEWLATGVINKNKTTRYVRINNSTFDVNSSYRTSQGGVRLNFGQSTDNDTWQFSLIETVSYVLLYQPSYNEHNSSAALHVDPRRWSNVLTVGGGVRFALVEDKTWLRGDREIRFMGTYDAISTIQETTAGFINSVSDFTLSSAPARWSFQTGATYTFTYFDRIQLQLSYDFEMRTKYTDNSAEIKLRFLL